MSKIEIAEARTVVAAKFFENVWGESTFVTRVVPLFIGLSALGNAFAQSFAMPRVKQELSKEGVLPFSRFWASDWPFNAPSGAIFLHWIFTVIFILGCRTPDVYNFVTNVFIYSGNWIKRVFSLSLFALHLSNLASSLSRHWPRLPQLCPLGTVGRPTHDIPQFTAVDHFLDLVTSIRAGGAIY
jgi:hypothetical protein